MMVQNEPTTKENKMQIMFSTVVVLFLTLMLVIVVHVLVQVRDVELSWDLRAGHDTGAPKEAPPWQLEMGNVPRESLEGSAKLPEVRSQHVPGLLVAACCRTKPWAAELLRNFAVERPNIVLLDVLVIQYAHSQNRLLAKLCLHRHAGRRGGDRAWLESELATTAMLGTWPSNIKRHQLRRHRACSNHL